MQVVCVTGVSGYIASWLVKLLLHRGNTVRATVRDTVGCWLLVGPRARPAGIHRFSHSSGRPRSPWRAAPRARWWPSWCRCSPTALATCGCSTRRTTAGSPGWSLSLIS